MNICYMSSISGGCRQNLEVKCWNEHGFLVVKCCESNIMMHGGESNTSFCMIDICSYMVPHHESQFRGKARPGDKISSLLSVVEATRIIEKRGNHFLG